jgi:signal transduction histidine kinase/DNA-binding response OmpR family regulator
MAYALPGAARGGVRSVIRVTTVTHLRLRAAPATGAATADPSSAATRAGTALATPRMLPAGWTPAARGARPAMFATRGTPGRCDVAFLGTLLGIGVATVLGGLWAGGVLADDHWWAAVALLGTVAAGFVCFGALREEKNEEAARNTKGALPAVPPKPEIPIEKLTAPLTDLLGDVGIAFLVTDAAGEVLRANSSAAQLLEHETEGSWAALHPTGTFFGLPIETREHLAPLHRFFSSEDAGGQGVVTVAGSRREMSWAGRVLSGGEDVGTVRLFVMRDVTAERRFEALKSDFLATLSHELRTPLTSLRGSLQLVLARTETLETMDRQLLEIGIKNAERLIGLVNDLLDIDSLEQGRLAFNFAPLEFEEVVAAAVDATAGAFENAGVRVEVQIPEPVPTVHGDRTRLEQVLVNLLGNAAKYAPAGSAVTVRVEPRDAGLQIDVTDTGPGIPAAEQPHVFERFWRTDRDSADAGAGLGLAICRAVVGRHGGQIWLESEEGHGATVSFYLPRSLFRLQGEQPADPVPAANGTRVLVVEDDADARAVLSASLERSGYAVVEAANGAEAVAAARREAPAAVILDLVLPDISGYDVLRILKNSPETASVPIVVLSVEAGPELAHRLGAWDVLQKPLDLEAVRWTVAQALRRATRPEGRLVVAMGPAVSRDLKVLAAALEEDGHRIYRALDVADLGDWTAANYPDVVVLDEDFLPQSRDETAELLRHPTSQNCIPLLFITANPQGEELPTRWAELQKPISKDDFVGAARGLLGDTAAL